MRFHPSVNLGVLKFLAFEQTFKNSLTSLPMGGGKGGSDFDPKGKSDAEVMRFCQAFMSELYRHIGADVDVPAGDIGVGRAGDRFPVRPVQTLEQPVHQRADRQRHDLRRQPDSPGSHWFRLRVLRRGNAQAPRADESKASVWPISGSGNVAQYAARKVMDLGGKVISLSDSEGTLYCRKRD